MNSIQKYIAGICCGVFFVGQAFAFQQSEIIQFQQALEEPGSRLNPILQIEQDDQGLMWFGTRYRGIQTFDGYDSQYLGWDAQNSNGLRGEEIVSIFKDREGTLWVSAKNRGAYRYDPARNYFEEFEIVGLNDESSVIGFSQTRDGALWAAVEGKGLYQADPVSKTFEVFDASIPTISYLHQLPNGNIVGGVQDGLFILASAKSMALIHLELGGIAPSAIGHDLEGDIWIGNKTGQLIEYSLENRTLEQPVERFSIAGAIINQIHLDQSDNLWIVCTKGIFLVKPNQEQPLLEKTPNQPGALNSSICWSLFEDKNGLIWVGTDNGLNIFDPYKNKFQEEDLQWDQDPAEGNYIASVFAEADGTLWVGTDDGYIHQKLPGEAEYRHIEMRLDQTMSYSKNFMAIAFYREGSGTLLLCTTQGLFRLYEEEERFERILISDRTKDQKVRAILRVSDEYHLYGTSWGLVVHNLTDDTFEVVLPHPDLEGLPNSITRIHQDSNGNIWVGTYGGLMLFEFANRRFHHPNIKSNLFPELFDSYGILHLAEYQNQLWVATLNYGFFQIALEDFFEDGTIDRPIRKWAYRNGLPDDVVYNITPDGNNNLWLATNNGISKFQLSDSTFVNYDILDGLMQDEFNMYAHARGQNGALYLGGVTGLNTIVPHEMATPNPFPPKVFFKDLTILNDTQERSIGNQLASFSLHTKEELELPYYQNFLRFTFYSDHYSSPEETTYEYKLSGVNDGWVRTTDVPSAIYTNLDPGKYTLQVRAANPDGIWGAPSSLQFTLTAPFWFDTWFYLFAISFATVLVVLAIYIRGKNSQKRQREMQATILEQTRDVHLQKDLIDAQNEEMKVSQENLTRLNNSKDFIFSILSHDLRSPLTTLKGFLGLLVESVDIFSKEEIVRLSNKIRQSVGTSLDMIDNILYWSQSQNGSISHKPQKLNLGQLAKETIEIYQLSAEKKGIELRAQVEDPLFVMADDNMLSFILRNLISNALKFTPKEGCITVVARSANEKQITLRVEDTGVGIQEEHLQKIFNPMQTYTTRGTANEKGTGLGLKLVQQFVKIHGGTFTVESTLGEGSQFIIYLPSHEGAVATAEPLG